MFKAPFSFNGRIRRLEYGISSIITVTASFIIIITAAVYPIFYFLFIPLIWFSLAAGAKRSHDRGLSGWYQIGGSLRLLFAESDFGPNEYGDNPKGIGNEVMERINYAEQR
ncbi:MAG: DUF805 domain-containing protein [Bacteroidota bacterium]